jgi:plastocyanin
MKKLLFLILLASSLFAKNYIVDQRDKTFIPHELHLKVGDTITFKNSENYDGKDGFAHNAYTDDEANEFDIGMQKPGLDVQVKIKAAGKFNVECAIHPNMLLEVTVK